MSNLSEQVAALERQRDALQELCGEVLACIYVNRKRETIKCADAVAEKQFNDILASFSRRYEAARGEPPEHEEIESFATSPEVEQFNEHVRQMVKDGKTTDAATESAADTEKRTLRTIDQECGSPPGTFAQFVKCKEAFLQCLEDDRKTRIRAAAEAASEQRLIEARDALRLANKNK